MIYYGRLDPSALRTRKGQGVPASGFELALGPALLRQPALAFRRREREWARLRRRARCNGFHPAHEQQALDASVDQTVQSLFKIEVAHEAGVARRSGHAKPREILLAPDQARNRGDDVVLERAGRSELRNQPRAQCLELRHVLVRKKKCVGVNPVPERTGRGATAINKIACALADIDLCTISFGDFTCALISHWFARVRSSFVLKQRCSPVKAFCYN